MRNPDWTFDQAWVRAPWDKDGAALRRITEEVRKIPAPSAQLDRALLAAEKAARGSKDLLVVFRWASLAERKANWQDASQASMTVVPAARALAGLRQGTNYMDVARLRFFVEGRWFTHAKTQAGLTFVAQRLYSKAPNDEQVLWHYSRWMAKSLVAAERVSGIEAARRLTGIDPSEGAYWSSLGSALRLHAGQENDLAIARQAIAAYREALRRPGTSAHTRRGAEIGIKQVHLRFPELDKGAARR